MPNSSQSVVELVIRLEQTGRPEILALAPEQKQQMATILAKRNITPDKVEKWFSPSESDALPPAGMLKNEDAALDIIAEAIEQGEQIGIYGDYDADGNTSLAQWVSYLKAIDAPLDYQKHTRINTRSEGYGMTLPKIHELHQNGVKVLIAVDMGTHERMCIEEAQKLGMKVVVLDHHNVGQHSDFPHDKNTILCNPHQEGDQSGLQDVSAASLVYTFLHHLEDRLGKLENRRQTFDKLAGIAALGVVADVVPLDHLTNRYVVQRGVGSLNRGDNIGIELLKEYLGLQVITASDIGFTFGPILNAASRMGDPDLGARLLLQQAELEQANATESEQDILAEAGKLARLGITRNEIRKNLSNEIYYPQAVSKAEAFVKTQLQKIKPIPTQKPQETTEDFLTRMLKEHIGVLVVSLPEMEADIRGILASRLKERFGVPVLALEEQRKGDRLTYKLSGRSVEGVAFDKLLLPALKPKPSWLLGAGGHAFACGGSIEGTDEALNSFIDLVIHTVGNPAKDILKDYRPEWDIEMTAEDIEQGKLLALLQALQAMEPLGKDNHLPRVKLKNMRITAVKEMGNGLHRSVTLNPANSVSGQQALEGGLVFFAEGTAFEKLLTQGAESRNSAGGNTKKQPLAYYDTQFDVTIEPFLQTRNNKQEISYHLKQIENLSPVPEWKKLKQTRKKWENRKIYSSPKEEPDALPPKYRLLDFKEFPEKPEVQQRLIEMAAKGLAAFDLETTGLDVSNHEARRTNSITQIAAIRPVWNSEKGIYTVDSFNRFISPENPRFFEYQWLAKQGKAPPYRAASYQYVSHPKALGVTGARFEYEEALGSVSGMTIKGESVEPDAVPFYTIVKDFLEFTSDSHLIGYNNANFDNPALLRHFWDTLAPLLVSGKYAHLQHSLENLHIVIPPELKSSPYRFTHPEALEAYAKAIDVEGIIEILAQRQKALYMDPREKELQQISDQLGAYQEGKLPLNSYDSSALQARQHVLLRQLKQHPPAPSLSPLNDIENPASSIDAMMHSLLLFGDGPSRRLDDMSVLIDADLARDDSKHDAEEDILPIIAMINEFSEQTWQQNSPEYYENIKRGIRNNRPDSVAGAWELMLREFDPGVKVEILPDEITEYVRGERAGELKDIIRGRIKITFSQEIDHNPKALAMQEFLKSLGAIHQQNRNVTTGMLDIVSISEPNEQSIILQSKSSSTSRKVKHFSVLKKALAVRELLNTDLVDNVRFFDSSAQVDIWPKGSNIPIEAVPLQSLRKSLPFLKDPAQKENFQQNLALLKVVDKLKFTSLGILDTNEGNTSFNLRGLQRGFGEARILTSKSTPAEYLSYIEGYGKFISNLANMPGIAEGANYLDDAEAENSEEEDIGKILQDEGWQNLILFANHPEYELTISKELYESVARYQEWPTVKNFSGTQKHFSFGSGIRGVYRKEQASYTLRGPLHSFGDISTPLGNMAYFLHRLNNLPGVSRLRREGDQIHLTFDPALDQNALWILHNSHIPFSAKQGYAVINGKRQPQGLITLRLDDKSNDLYHYSWELKRHHRNWRNLQQSQSYHNEIQTLEEIIQANKPITSFETKRLSAEDIQTLAKIIPLREHLLKGELQEASVDSLGTTTITSATGTHYRIIPNEDGSIKLIFNKDTGELKPKASSVLRPKIPPEKKVRIRLAQQLSQLSMLKGIYATEVRLSESTKNPFRITLQFPDEKPDYSLDKKNFTQESYKLDILPRKEADFLNQQFETVSQLTQSRSLSGITANLRQIVAEKDLMQASHYEEAESLTHKISTLNKSLQKNKADFVTLVNELHAMGNKDIYLNYRDVLFRNLNAISTVREAVEKLQYQSQPHHPDHQQREKFLEEYAPLFNQLHLAEFKRYRIALDSAEMLKEMLPILGLYAAEATSKEQEELTTAAEKIGDLLKQYGYGSSLLGGSGMETLQKAKDYAFKHFPSASGYAEGTPHDHRILSTTIEKLDEACNRLQTSLNLGNQEITRAATTLLHDDSLKPLREMASHVEKESLHQAEKNLRQLERAGLVSNIHINPANRTIRFDAEGLLKPVVGKDTQEESKQYLEQMFRGTLGPPFTLLDTSTLITMLTMLPDVPGSKDTGYLHLLTSLTQTNQITPVITSAVLAELLNSPIPLAIEDVLVIENGEAKGIREDTISSLIHFQQEGKKNIFPKYYERIEWLKELYNTQKAHFTTTSLDDSYLEIIRKHPNSQTRRALENAWSRHSEQPLDEVNLAELKSFLLSNTSARHSFVRLISRYKLRDHMGEMSLAYAADNLQRLYGHNVPILISCDSTDLQGRLNQIYHRRDNCYPLADNPEAPIPPRFNPLHRQYNAALHAQLGNICYFSTYALMQEMQKAFDQKNQHKKAVLPLFSHGTDNFSKNMKKALDTSASLTSRWDKRYEYNVDSHVSATTTNPEPHSIAKWMKLVPPDQMEVLMQTHAQRLIEFHQSAESWHSEQARTHQQTRMKVHTDLRQRKPIRLFDSEALYQELQLLKEHPLIPDDWKPEKCLEILKKHIGTNPDRMKLVTSHPHFVELFPEAEIAKAALAWSRTQRDNTQHQR